jgi:energy-coupling factor transport system permease protein
MKQPWAWMGWLITVLVILSITRNPLYLVLILMCVLFVGISLRQAGAELPTPISLWKLAGWIILLATVFNGLTSHYGATVLLTIPGRVPLLSGNVTLDAIVYGATNGLVLTGMLASFSVLSLALPVRDLISLIPRAFFPMAVVTSIAVTYLPTTLRQFKQIREAQAVRGHQMRSLRDWLPLLMPLLVGGLEHAMQLAEAMTARGFASSKTSTSNHEMNLRLAMFVGMLLVALGWIAQLASVPTVGFILIVSGAVLILAGLWYIGRESPRTAYHRRPWGWQDWLSLAISLVVLLACLLPLTGLGSQALEYEPYPALSLPAFNPLLGIIMLGLLTPGILAMKVRSQASLPAESLKEGHRA